MDRDAQTMDPTDENLPRRSMVQGAGALMLGAMATAFGARAVAAAPASPDVAPAALSAGKHKKNKKKGKSPATPAGLLVDITYVSNNGAIDGEGTAMCTATCPAAPVGQRAVALSGSWVAAAQLPAIASYPLDDFSGWTHWGSSSTKGKKTYTCGVVCGYFTT